MRSSEAADKIGGSLYRSDFDDISVFRLNVATVMILYLMLKKFDYLAYANHAASYLVNELLFIFIFTTYITNSIISNTYQISLPRTNRLDYSKRIKTDSVDQLAHNG